MALRAAFCAPAACASRAASAAARAARATVTVERVATDSATVSWAAAAPRGAYIVDYGRGEVCSRRVTARPRARLRNLTPGAEYAIRVRAAASGADVAAGTLTTAACAGPAGAVAEEEEEKEVPAPLPMTELSRLEMRVGRILDVERHPDADALYVEHVDVGEDEPRVIVSGLVQFCTPEELTGRRVVVLCNLKPRSMRGVVSHGMLMCASNGDKSAVDPLLPHEDAVVGELVAFEGHQASPIEPGNRASKAFDRVADFLTTDSEGVAMFKDVPFRTASGPCVSPRKLVGPVS